MESAILHSSRYTECKCGYQYKKVTGTEKCKKKNKRIYKGRKNLFMAPIAKKYL